MKNVKDIFTPNQPKWKPFPLNLQLFGEENGADSGASGGENAAHGAQEPAEQPRTYTEEELQAAIDSTVRQRLARERRDAEKRIEQAREEARSEAEKLAQMNEAQRAEHERQRTEQAARDREAAIAQREAEITRRELRAEAIETLHKRGLPTGLEAVLNYTDADACNASIDTVEKAFREAVQQGVDERLRQSGVTVRAGNAPDYGKMSDAEYYAATYKTGGQK